MSIIFIRPYFALLVTFAMALALNMSSVLAATSSKRIALVIGNSMYENSPIDNPTNDANDIAKILSDELGFSTHVEFDLDNRGMIEAANQLQKDSMDADVRLFYYAGHGLNSQGDNYLLPIGSNPQTVTDITFDAFPLSRLLSNLEHHGGGTNIVILDACRNNQVTEYIEQAKTGFKSTFASSNTFIFYATSSGSTASDGDGRNGTFTKHLLTRLAEPGLELEDLAKQVTAAVIDETNGNQRPWRDSSLSKSIYLAGSEKEFDFLSAASNVESVKRKLCTTKDSTKARDVNLEAESVFFGKYKHAGQADQRKGWSLFTRAIELCSLDALMTISKTLVRMKRCDTAVQYAQLASDYGYAVANRFVQQIQSNSIQICNSK